MKYEELAFVNQQLAGMLKSGIPLEGSLRQLCLDMQRGPLRTELEKLEADLAHGMPFNQAMAARQLPEFYRLMVQAGARSNDLPGMLALLGDYYQRANSLWTRLKGLMVYPLIVLLTAFGLSLFLAVIFNALAGSGYQELKGLAGQETPGQHAINVGLYLPAIFLGLIACAGLAAITIPALRRLLRWRLPGFKESSLSLAASTIKLMLQGGQSLTQAIGILQHVEEATPAGEDLQRWQRRLAEGRGKFSEFAGENKIFPPLFVWLVAQGGEDVVTGFGRAAEVYYARAMNRMDLLLYAALPVSVLLLGMMIVGQVLPAMRVFSSMLGSLGDLEGSPAGN